MSCWLYALSSGFPWASLCSMDSVLHCSFHVIGLWFVVPVVQSEKYWVNVPSQLSLYDAAVWTLVGVWVTVWVVFWVVVWLVGVEVGDVWEIFGLFITSHCGIMGEVALSHSHVVGKTFWVCWVCAPVICHCWLNVGLDTFLPILCYDNNKLKPLFLLLSCMILLLFQIFYLMQRHSV